MSKSSYVDPSDNSLVVFDLEGWKAEQDLKELVELYGADPDDPNSIMAARRIRHERMLNPQLMSDEQARLLRASNATKARQLRELQEAVEATDEARQGVIKGAEDILDTHRDAVKGVKKRARASKRQRSNAGKVSTLRGDTRCIFWLAIANRLIAYGIPDDDRVGDFSCNLVDALVKDDYVDVIKRATGYFNGDDDAFAEFLMEKNVIGSRDHAMTSDTQYLPIWFREAEERDGVTYALIQYSKSRGKGVETVWKEFSLQKVKAAIKQVRKVITEKS